MTSFSFKELQKITAGKTGYALDLAANHEEARAVGGLATSASSFLNTAVACILTDLHQPARQLLEKKRPQDLRPYSLPNRIILSANFRTVCRCFFAFVLLACTPLAAAPELPRLTSLVMLSPPTVSPGDTVRVSYRLAAGT